MIDPGTLRVGGWSLAAGGVALVTGLQWAMQPVEVPLVAILVLTFLPLGTINKALQQFVEPGGQSDG